MAEYFTTENIYVALKFAGVLTAGLYTGGSIYQGVAHIPSMLAMSDMSQALVQFQYYWPRERQLPICGLLSGLFGIVVYLIKRDPNDLPWLCGGVAMTFWGIYTVAVIFPRTIGRLLQADPKKDKDEKHIRALLQGFISSHCPRMLTGVGVFIAYTYCFGFK